NFATTMTNALAGKQPLDSTLTTLSGKTADGIIEYLRLGEAAKLAAASGVLSNSGWAKFPLTGGVTLIVQWGRWEGGV
ncbi:phage tail protein, partial [Enterobacter hormaechei subsp. hoffmannii]|nr:phage tail protein [Enterobacter hormaechei subsp. hoffmannii]